jgi:SAM-dependent methyltransferase
VVSSEGGYVPPRPTTLPEEQRRLERQAQALWEAERGLLTRSGLEPGQRVLDLGCGPGRVLSRLSTAKPRLLLGVDVSRPFLKEAAGLASVLQADVARLPLASDCLDFVYTRFVLRHIRERPAAIAEVHRVLRPGGVFAAMEPDEASLQLDPVPELWPRLFAGLTQTAVRRGGDPFIGRTLRRRLSGMGFEIVSSEIIPISTDQFSPSGFVQTFLAPGARPLDPDLMPPDMAQSAWEAVRQWSSRPVAFGYGVCIFTAARKVG